jgi:hypothetical protein
MLQLPLPGHAHTRAAVQPLQEVSKAHGDGAAGNRRELDWNRSNWQGTSTATNKRMDSRHRCAQRQSRLAALVDLWCWVPSPVRANVGFCQPHQRIWVRCPCRHNDFQDTGRGHSKHHDSVTRTGQ